MNNFKVHILMNPTNCYVLVMRDKSSERDIRRSICQKIHVSDDDISICCYSSMAIMRNYGEKTSKYILITIRSDLETIQMREFI